MESKKRNMLVMGIAFILAIGVMSSFGLPLIFQTKTIVLPDITETHDIAEPDSLNSSQSHTLLQVTSKTVKDVIATLHREDRYYREFAVELYWSENGQKNNATSTVLVWNDGKYSKTAVMCPDGTLKNYLKANDTIYFWSGSDKNWFEYHAEDSGVDDAQRIPTYENILKLKDDTIAQANYETKLGQNCIFVESLYEPLQYVERFWVSVDTGLLVYAETEKNGDVIYRMNEKIMTTLEENNDPFTLPDGTQLHSVVTFETEE